MLLSFNPKNDGIANIINHSAYKAAKWIKEDATGNLWYWPAEQETHAAVAAMVDVVEYTKGIAVME